MSNRFALLAVSLAMGIATAAIAQETAPSAAPAEAPKPEQKLVCKKERSIGSQMVKRVCRTQAQIDAEREAARQGLETGDNRCVSGASCKGG